MNIFSRMRLSGAVLLLFTGEQSVLDGIERQRERMSYLSKASMKWLVVFFVLLELAIALLAIPIIWLRRATIIRRPTP